MTTLVLNEDLKEELVKNNLTLYFSFHRMIHHSFQEMINKKIKENKHIKILHQDDLAECLAKTNLVITDFSSIIFDLMYRKKPFIIYVPDSNDPNIDKIYRNDYIYLIERMKKREFKIENVCDTIKETVDKIIYYIQNKFQIDEKLQKFYDYIGFKNNGEDFQKFVDYLKELK